MSSLGRFIPLLVAGGVGVVSGVWIFRPLLEDFKRNTDSTFDPTKDTHQHLHELYPKQPEHPPQTPPGPLVPPTDPKGGDVPRNPDLPSGEELVEKLADKAESGLGAIRKRDEERKGWFGWGGGGKGTP